MLDCTYFLYKALLNQFPYIPSGEVERDAERLRQIKADLNRIPEPYRIDMIRLIDCTVALEDDRCQHAFQLGLDVGLSIAQESRYLQVER